MIDGVYLPVPTMVFDNESDGNDYEDATYWCLPSSAYKSVWQITTTMQ